MRSEPTSFSTDPHRQDREPKGFEDEHPIRFALSGESNLSIEAECTTGKSDPQVAARNLCKAMAAGR